MIMKCLDCEKEFDDNLLIPIQFEQGRHNYLCKECYANYYKNKKQTLITLIWKFIPILLIMIVFAIALYLCFNGFKDTANTLCLIPTGVISSILFLRVKR